MTDQRDTETKPETGCEQWGSWRDISTAPKDGSMFRVKRDDPEYGLVLGVACWKGNKLSSTIGAPSHWRSEAEQNQ